MQHFVGNVLDSEWKDLQDYTRSFSSASICTDEGPKIPGATSFRFGQLQGATKTLFPSLQHLNFTNTTPGSSPFHLPFLFAPALRDVVIVNVGTASNFAFTVAAFLHRLSEEATLEHLTLDSLCLTSHIIRSIGHCRQLKTLNLKNIKGSLDGLDVLMMLGGLSGLHDLTITVADDLNYLQACHSSPLCSNPSVDSVELSALKSLQLAGERPMVQDILDRVVVSRNLETLFIHFTGYRYYLPPPPHRKSGKKLPKKHIKTPEVNPVKTIAHGLATTLKLFSLKFNATSFENIRVPHNMITDLAKLQNLENLDLSGILLPIEGLDITFNTLSDFWPKIQHLRLPLVSENHLYLSTLAVIAKSCPNLIYLECSIDLHTGVKSFSVPPEGMVSHRLETLVVSSPVDPPPSETRLARAVANFLYALFPDIVAIIEIHPSQFWREVSELVQMCQQAREYDKKRRQDGK